MSEAEFMQLIEQLQKDLDRLLQQSPSQLGRVSEITRPFGQPDGTCDIPCTPPSEGDPWRRIAIDFSTMTNLETDVFSDWFTPGVFQSFLEGTRFEIVFNNLSFNSDNFDLNNAFSNVSNDQPIALGYNFDHAAIGTDLPHNCGTGLALFEISGATGPSERPKRVNHSFYRNPCDILEDAPQVISPHAYEFIPLLDGSCNNTDSDNLNPYADRLHIDEDEEGFLNYSRPRMNIVPTTTPDNILEDVNDEFTTVFNCSFDDLLIDNPWEFNNDQWEPLFDCTGSEYHGRVSFPYFLLERCDLEIRTPTQTLVDIKSGDVADSFANVHTFGLYEADNDLNNLEGSIVSNNLNDNDLGCPNERLVYFDFLL
ncbi:MAG: hypothetical protein AAF193_11460, partial [Bacteroidota bacterium]